MLTACPACGASNAATRLQCGRCGREMTGGAGTPQGAVRKSATRAERRAAAAEQLGDGGPSRGLIVGVIVVLLVVCAAAAALSITDTGPFAQASGSSLDTEADLLEAVDVRASSARASSGGRTFHAANVLDSEVATSWQHGVGSDEPEWIEMRLDEPAEISKVILWNGDQSEGSFDDYARISRAVVDVDDRRFVVDLLDVDGPQAIDLPESVLSDYARITVDGTFEGQESGVVAVSRMELRGEAPE